VNAIIRFHGWKISAYCAIFRPSTHFGRLDIPLHFGLTLFMQARNFKVWFWAVRCNKAVEWNPWCWATLCSV